jgi:L-ascorbate metabolism protein UlaG (beta-lactamase superfamily)
MLRSRVFASLVAPLAAVSIIAAAAAHGPGVEAPAAPATAAVQGGTVTMEYLGWSVYRFTSPTGKVLLTNPWITHFGSPLTLDDVPRADLLLVTNGHLDEFGDAIPLSERTGARIVAPAELNFWFMASGVPENRIASTFFSPGDRFMWEGITIRMVNSVHGTGIIADLTPTTDIPTGGIAAGYFITFENGFTVYFAGSSAATMDQAIWGRLYQPDLAILHMGGGHEPLDFAAQVELLMTGNPNLAHIFPHHHFPALGPGTTVGEVQAAIDAMGLGLRVTEPAMRGVYSFSK